MRSPKNAHRKIKICMWIEESRLTTLREMAARDITTVSHLIRTYVREGLKRTAKEAARE